MHLLCLCEHCKVPLNISIVLFFLWAINMELEKGTKSFVVLYAGFENVRLDELGTILLL